MRVKAKVSPQQGLFEKLTALYISLVLTFFLFYCGQNGYQGILQSKAHLFFLICGGYVLTSLLLFVEGILVGEIKPHSLKWTIAHMTQFQKCVAVYIVLTWISSILSPYGITSIIGASRYEGALTITFYGLSAILVSKYGKLRKAWLYLVVAVTSLFCALCLFQLYGGNPFELYPAGYNYFGAYVDYAGAYLGTIGNVDLVAAFLCMVIPLLLGVILKSGWKLRGAALIPLILAMLVLLKMSVLAGLVGVFGCLILSLLVLLPQSNKGQRIAWLIFIAVSIGGLLLIYSMDIGDGMLHEVHQLLHGNIDVTFGSGRIYIWQEVLRRIPEHLWFGTGPDTMLKAGIEGFSRFDALHGIQIISEIDVAHNEYLNVLYHQGIFAFLAYGTIIFLSFIKWLRYGSQDPSIAVLGMAVIGYAIQAFFGFSMCITAPFFWLLLGLLDGCDAKN